MSTNSSLPLPPPLSSSLSPLSEHRHPLRLLSHLNVNYIYHLINLPNQRLTASSYLKLSGCRNVGKNEAQSYRV